MNGPIAAAIYTFTMLTSEVTSQTKYKTQLNICRAVLN